MTNTDKHTFHPAEIKAMRIGAYPTVPRAVTDAERIAELRAFNFNATADRFEELVEAFSIIDPWRV